MRAFIALAFCGAALAADVTVGTATARPGEKATGALAVPAGVDAAASLAVIVINGSKPGPTLALVSGAHGTEYASIIAMEKLAESIDPAQLSGAVIVVPLVNPASFAQKVPHLNPVDGKNMNRYYPGKADGTQTERVSWAIAKQVVEKCDYLIDFHGGDLDENLRRYAYWADTGNPKLDNTTRGMCWPSAWITLSFNARGLPIRLRPQSRSRVMREASASRPLQPRPDTRARWRRKM